MHSFLSLPYDGCGRFPVQRLEGYGMGDWNIKAIFLELSPQLREVLSYK